MGADLSARVEAAARALRQLDAAAADRYFRALRTADPEVARRVDAARWALGSEGGPTCSADPPADGDGATASFGAGPAAATPPDPPPGESLGRYRLLRVVGRGGFGEVWQAYDPVLRKHVAVKTALRRDPDRPAAFLGEARKAAALRHPAVVQVFDVAEADGGWYIVSEFVEGESLRSRLEAGRVPFDRAARIVAAVAGALHAAHLAGLVHRDVKPANILLDRAGDAYLTDFGLAATEDELPAERWKVSGTLAYMPPEQVRGDTHLLDGRADIYSLGAVLYELLTGRPAVRAADPDEYRELILRREPRPPRAIDPAVPAELERICLTCLAKEVRDRYRTAADLAADLEAWLAAESARPAPRRFHPVGVLAGVLAVAMLGGLLGSALLHGGRTEPTPPAAGGANVEPSKPQKVKELLWPRRGASWDVAAGELVARAESTGLLQLGDASAPDWEFAVAVRRVAAAGRVGVFLGHRADPAAGAASFEAVYFEVIGDALVVQRSVERYPLDDPGRVQGFVQGSEALGPARAAHTLRVVVRGGRSAEVWADGKAAPALAGGDPPPPAAGPFGAYLYRTDGTFADPRLNGAALPLTR